DFTIDGWRELRPHSGRLDRYITPKLSRWRRPDRVPLGTFGEVGPRYLLLLFQQAPVGGALQELEDVFRHRARNLDRLRRSGSPDPIRSRHGKPQARFFGHELNRVKYCTRN